MSWTGLDTFDTAIQKADIWLKDIMNEINTDNRRVAYTSLRAVLHALRDRLIVDEAVDLGAQLPLLIKGIYYEDWNPSKTPVKDRHIDEFIAHIKERFRGDGQPDFQKMARAVFTVLKKRVTEGEMKDVKGMMPAELKSLWE